MFHFFAYLSRLKLIDRWSLMRCVNRENVQEHSHQVAVIAHALAVIRNRKFSGNVNAERIATMALFHDATEVLTGDMPTPVKYFSGEIRAAYRAMEGFATEQLLRLLPNEFRGDYRPLLSHANEAEKLSVEIIKAADTICAYLKCLEERAAGNLEFVRAQKSIEGKLQEQLKMPEVEFFLKEFAPSFNLTLDDLSQPFDV